MSKCEVCGKTVKGTLCYKHRGFNKYSGFKKCKYIKENKKNALNEMI